MRQKLLRQAILIVAFLTLSINLQSQVTIGSEERPNTGTLLDLKERPDGTSSKGLGLPRVALKSRTALYPMFTTTVDTLDAGKKSEHTGLIVFNTNKCKPFGRGIYIWDGISWEGINPEDTVPTPALIGVADTLFIPSGHDKRIAAPQSTTFSWVSGGNATWSDLTTIITPLLFTSFDTQMTPASQTWITSPATLTVDPDLMPVSDIETSLISHRGGTTTISVPATECGVVQSKKVVLLQTNYAIQTDTRVDASVNTLAVYDDVTTKKLTIQSNAPWRVTSAINAPDVLSSYTTGGGLHKPTSRSTSDFAVVGATVGAGKKYSSAHFTLSDPFGRAKDLKIAVIQCGSTPDYTPHTEIPGNSDRSDWRTAWGTKVIRHQAKPGVYEEFFSADFGTAGRWMTTNLSAKNYDGITHAYGRTLTGPTTPGYASYKGATWCYPKAPGVIVPTEGPSAEYIANPHIGLLYSWDAATGGKGGNSGVEDIQTVPAQGICPKGWHLPSDAEWTQLTDAIAASPFTYTYSEKPLPPTYTSYQLGRMVTDPCASNKDGASRQPYNQSAGIALITAGWAYADDWTSGGASRTESYGTHGYYWTRDNYNDGNPYGFYSAWMRRLYPNANQNIGGFMKAWHKRDRALSVRCKKD